MISHFTKTAFRQFRRHLSFSLINLFGLATAMAVCLMISLYVGRELSFDRFHEHAANIYRLDITLDIQGDVMHEPFTSPAMGPDLLDAFPEVKDMVRLSFRQPVNIWQNDRDVSISNTHYADSTFFDVFSFELLRGDPSRALAEPYSMVITESLAAGLFPGADPLGKLVRLDDAPQKYIITGIAADCQPNSHLQFELLRSFSTMIESTRSNITDWDANMSYYTYVLLAEGTDVDALLAKTEALTYEKVNYKFEGMGLHLSLGYFPLTHIRLHSPFSSEMDEAGTMWKVWLFSVVALFVLFIAGFNYVNLCIAKSGRRAREIGIRKVLGAHKSLLRKQFYTETLLITGISFLLAIVLVDLFMPLFNRMLDAGLSISGVPWWGFLATFILFAGLFGVLASIYPAWYMSSFQPVRILKGELWSRPGRFQPRSLLLLIQFVISMALIVCTLIVFLQVRFFQTTDRGFNEERLIAVRSERPEDAELFMQGMAGYPWVVQQSIGTSFPAGSSYMEGITPENSDPGFMAHRLWVDRNYIATLEASLKEGRLFERESGYEEHNALVNEALVRKAGWNDPIGKTIERGGRTYTVTGVLNDYHFQSLHYEVEPLLINTLGSIPGYYSQPFWVLIRYDNGYGTEVTETVREVWTSLFSDKTLHYVFVPELLDLQIATERNFGRLFLTFTLLAIIIAMLGVLGLSSFAAQQRLKETAIKKVLGASSFSILFGMSSEFLKWIAIAAVVALPVAYLYMERWLSGFARAIDFPYWTLLVSLAGMLTIALLVVFSQSLRAAHSNPAQVLKTE